MSEYCETQLVDIILYDRDRFQHFMFLREPQVFFIDKLKAECEIHIESFHGSFKSNGYQLNLKRL